MRRSLLLLVVGFLGLLGQTGVIAAQQSTEMPLDLPALVLTPDDLAAAGLPGYGHRNSALHTTPEAMSAEFVGGESLTEALIVDFLGRAGLQRYYVVWFDLVDPETGETVRRVVSSIHEYDDAGGAAAGIEAVAILRTALDPTATVLATTRPFGDQAQMILAETAPVVDAPTTKLLDVQFRFGQRVAGVTIFDYTDQQPEIATVEALAGIMVDKLQNLAAQEQPGLSFRALRLTGAEVATDVYFRRDGAIMPIAGETAEHLRVRELSYGTAPDVYRTFHFLPVDPYPTHDLRVLNLVLGFADEAEAAAYLDTLPDVLAQDPEVGELTVLPDRPGLGDEAITLMEASTGGDSPETWVVVRDGALVTYVAAGTDSLAIVDALAAAATSCLQSVEWCPPATISPQ